MIINKIAFTISRPLKDSNKNTNELQIVKEKENKNIILFLYLQCVFADSANKLIFITYNHGRDIERIKLDFSPSEIAFYDKNDVSTDFVLLVLDKNDPARKVIRKTLYFFLYY